MRMAKILRWLIAGVLLSVSVVGCGLSKDAKRDALTAELLAHPLANPQLSFGEPASSFVTGYSTATGLSKGVETVLVRTRFKVGEDRVDDAVLELREQAEALGYEFEQDSKNFMWTGPVDGLTGGVTILIAPSSVTFSVGSTLP